MQEVGRMANTPHDRDKTETGDAIAVVRYVPDRDFPEEEGVRSGIQDTAVDSRTFRIRFAKRDECRNSANILIHRMYSWRGYTTSCQTSEIGRAHV